MLAYRFVGLSVLLIAFGSPRLRFLPLGMELVVSREKVAEIERKAPLHLYFPTVSYRPLQFAS